MRILLDTLITQGADHLSFPAEAENCETKLTDPLLSPVPLLLATARPSNCWS